MISIRGVLITFCQCVGVSGKLTNINFTKLSESKGSINFSSFEF